MTGSSDTQRARRPFVLFATFLAGLLLGGVIVWTVVGRDDDAATAPDTPAATPSTSGATVTISAQCVLAAEGAQRIITLTREAATAIERLDARRLQEIVDEMETLESQISRSAEQCEASGAP